MSGKRVAQILQTVGEQREAIQHWSDLEMQTLVDKYIADPNVNMFLVDNVNGDGVCSHCGNYNIRFMVSFTDSSNTYTLSISEKCLGSFVTTLNTEEMASLIADVKSIIKMRNSVLCKMEESEYARVRYPHALQVNTKIQPLILAQLPVPDSYSNEVRLAVTTQKALHEKTTYYMTYQKYIRYVRLSLKLQPYSSFLLSINDKMKKCERLSPSILEALDRGMTEGWESRLKESLVIKDLNRDAMIEYEKRLDRLLLCRCGFTRNTIVSFRKQLRNGKPLSDRQIEVLKEWEEKFSKQLEALATREDTSSSLIPSKA